MTEHPRGKFARGAINFHSFLGLGPINLDHGTRAKAAEQGPGSPCRAQENLYPMHGIL